MNENSTNKKNGLVKKIVVGAIVAAMLAAYYLVPSVHTTIGKIFEILGSGDLTLVEEFMASYGTYAAIVSFFLMILTCLAAPIPAFLITLTNANLFGWWQGAILSWSSAMAGAAICFYIARILGRDAVIKLTSKSGLEQIDTFFEKYGRNTVMVCRLLPFVSFDIVSYAAGLTSMSFIEFFVATGIGQLPATIVYSYVGGMLTGGAQMLMTGLLILFALSILVATMKKIYDEKQKNK